MAKRHLKPLGQAVTKMANLGLTDMAVEFIRRHTEACKMPDDEDPGKFTVGNILDFRVQALRNSYNKDPQKFGFLAEFI